MKNRAPNQKGRNSCSPASNSIDANLVITAARSLDELYHLISNAEFIYAIDKNAMKAVSEFMSTYTYATRDMHAPGFYLDMFYAAKFGATVIDLLNSGRLELSKERRGDA